MVSKETVQWVLRTLVIWTLLLGSRSVEGCAAQYRKELRYLDYYLGIAPTVDDGALKVNDAAIGRYVDDALALRCDFRSPCLWTNAESDDLLDTSDFYLFNKTDGKTFPIQIRPGDANPMPNSLFLLAGNTTSKAQSAILISAPIACQKSEGVLTFQYWLYNAAKVEVVLLRVNKLYGHLQVISRPQIDCHFLKSHGLCRVEIEKMNEPFRIGIRIFSLRDQSVGSFGMIADIHYTGNLCGMQELPSLFDGQALNKPLSKIPITSGSQLNCAEKIENCLWSTATATSTEQSSTSLTTDSPLMSNTDSWQIGKNIKRWEDTLRLSSKPDGDFIYQYVDPMAHLPLPRLRSVFVPCTQTPSSLSFRYWMSSGLQAQVCSIGNDNMAYSCVYLEMADSPGPVTIDIDTADTNPFAFSFEVIHFSKTTGGIIVIDDIEFNGILCSETIPTTTQSPLSKAALFELQPFPTATQPFSDTLNCDFETDLCSHWTNEDTIFMYGFVPPSADIEQKFKGNVAVALFAKKGGTAELSSQIISCAHGGRFMVDYLASENAKLSLCANDRCVQQREPFGQLAVNLTSVRPFRIRILAESADESFVIIKRMTTSEDGFCSLQTASQLACKSLKCGFKDNHLCSYRNLQLASNDAKISTQQSNTQGTTVKLDEQTPRFILRSPNFELSSPVELRFEASLSAFGARLYVCADEADVVDLTSCELVLGPKPQANKLEKILVQLDADIKQFAFIAVHDKAEQFGEALLQLTKIEITDSNGNLIC